MQGSVMPYRLRGGFAGVLAALLALTGSAWAQDDSGMTYFVDATFIGSSDGSMAAPFRTIGDALAAVTPNNNDVVMVRPGNYGQILTVPAGTSLVSEAGATHTLIQGSPVFETDLLTLRNGAVLRGFTIGDTGGAGVAVPLNASAEISNCVFYQCNVGLRVEVDSEVVCFNSTFFDNNIGLRGNVDSTLKTINNNSFVENGVGISVGSGGTLTGAYNAYFDNGVPVQGADPSDLDFVGNPLWNNRLNLNFHLRANSKLRNAGNPNPAFNDKDGSRNDVGSDGGPFGQIDSLAPQLLVTTTPSPATGNPPFSVLFDASSSFDEWGISRYTWDFDAMDGLQDESFGPSVPVLFREPGGYLVTLRAQDNSGITASSVFEVNVGNPPLPSIDYSPTSGPAPLSVDFDADADETLSGVTYAWDFDGNGTTDSLQEEPTFTYPQGTEPGAYTVTLTVTDADDVATQRRVSVTISDYAVANSLEVGPGDPARDLTVSGGALNGLKVAFPANSLSQRHVVTVSAVPQNTLPFFPEGDVLATFNLGPSGTVFADSVDVSLPLAVTTANIGDIAVYTYDPEAQAWFNTGISRVRVLENPARVAFKTAHFSTFAIIDEGRPTTPPPTGGGCFDNGNAKRTDARADILIAGFMLLVLAGYRRRVA